MTGLTFSITPVLRYCTVESVVRLADEPPDSGALRTHIHELRLQVDRSFDTALITTVHSVGWRMQT